MADILSSRAAIEALHTRGWTDTAIGRLVGRDSSLIHQVGVGKKPGSNLAGSLNALVDSGLRGPKSSRLLPDIPVMEPARRLRASGLPAGVRMGRVEREALRGGPTGAPVRIGAATHGARTVAPHIGGAVRELPNGQRRITGASKASARFAAGLAGDMGGASRIKIAYKDKDGKWHTIGQKGGLTPEALRGYTRGRSWREALAAMAAHFYAKGGGGEPTGEAEFYIVGAGA